MTITWTVGICLDFEKYRSYSLIFIEALVEFREVLREERFYLIGFRLLAHAHKERPHHQHQRHS